jgi:hypothetical protein
MAIPIYLLPVGEGRLPDGTTAPFFIDRRELDAVRDNGPGWKYHDARFIEEAVTDPDAIFEGLRRPNQADSVCYSVQPTRDPDADEDPYGIGTPPVFGQVFLAFVTLGQMGYVVFDWEWRPGSPDEPGYPENWRTDFVRRVWHRP